MTIEKEFDISFIGRMALQEKQIQQNYRPIIAIHKWFARRPGTLFRGLLLSEFVPGKLTETFYASHKLDHLRIGDPFMGGGTPLVEANRVGCDVVGFDINPMAYWIVRQELGQLHLGAYRNSASSLIDRLTNEIGRLYQTRCVHCGSSTAHVKYFLWVKVQSCTKCGCDIDLMPGYLIAENRRHPKNVLLCPSCGALNEVQDRKNPGTCTHCFKPLLLHGPARGNRCPCPTCGTSNTYPDATSGAPRHRMIAIEYHCPRCKMAGHVGRFFKTPDTEDTNRYKEAEARWLSLTPNSVPDDAIPRGDETDRLHRWGYQYYREMFNARQLLGLELSAQAVQSEPDDSVRDALATNLSDLLRYQNMLCRYDTMALKSLDIFSVHGFPVGLVQCESNLLGIANGDGTNVGSGGWSNIVEKYSRAKAYCSQPFEILERGGRKEKMPILGERIGEQGQGGAKGRQVELFCQSSTAACLPAASLDAVLTDPPYYSNVQYAELMDFCYVWLRRLIGNRDPAFRLTSTRNVDELTGNATMERGLDHFTEGLSSVFEHMARAMKPGAPLAFTYHHNSLEAYYPVAVAVLDSGLVCSASLPCPAEMGASIHINGTGSSIVDTIFVCRSTGVVPRRWIAQSAEEVAVLVTEEVRKLELSGMKPTRGDIRCIIHGHLVRLSVWRLRNTWDKTTPTLERMANVAEDVQGFCTVEAVEARLADVWANAPLVQSGLFGEEESTYEVDGDEISF